MPSTLREEGQDICWSEYLGSVRGGGEVTVGSILLCPSLMSSRKESLKQELSTDV